MSDDPLIEEYRGFLDDVLIKAEGSSDPQRMCFFRLFSELASDNGDTADLEYTPVLKEGRGGYQIDGYALDTDRGELCVSVCGYFNEDELQTLNSAGMESFFRRVDSFLEKSSDNDFISELEETSPAFEAAYSIFSNITKIKRIRVILLTNAVLSIRKKVLEAGTILNKPVSYNVLDFSRYVDILNSGGGTEPVEIDIGDLNGQPLTCLPAHIDDTDYESYLVVLPGKFLANIYGLYGARLLEQNVRVFLQARTKVNRGIIDTLRDTPEMFFAYNNGLTATAAEVNIVKMPGGTLGISSIKNLQIVNGGQTTASILDARDQTKADLERVFVQMKLSVIRPESIENIVPKISRFANTQNKISEADFFSSHPFHVEMEKISRRLSAPPKAGALAPTKWFYERARGQYKDASAYGTQRERKTFSTEFPKNQLINKTDFAKYQATFDCVPHLVSRGAQKCFLEFAEGVSEKWEKSPDAFNEGYFRDSMAKAIVFRQTDKLVGKADWYKDDRGYKANIVTYTISWLVNQLNTVNEVALDLQEIWSRQELPEEFADTILGIAREISAEIKKTPHNVSNVGEYAKQQQCWARISKLEVPLPSSLMGFTKSLSEIKQQTRVDISEGKMHREIDFETDLFNLQPRVSEIVEFAKEKQLMSPRSSNALKKIERLDLNLTRPEKNALKHLFEKMEERGFDF